jgi:hypothetical protein
MDDPRTRLERERQRTLYRLASLTDDFDEIVTASRDSNADDEHDPEGSTIAFERSQLGLPPTERPIALSLAGPEPPAGPATQLMADRCQGLSCRVRLLSPMTRQLPIGSAKLLYLDGNGRTGRLLLNLLLVRLGYPPAIVFKNERTKYLDAMRKADKGDYGPMGELIARAVTNNLYRFVVPAVAGPSRLVPLASLADEKAGITPTALRAAAERGRLRAQKSDSGIWLSSRKWVAEYQKNKHKRTSKVNRPAT